ncbi:MAG: glycoside hydrolase family 65 protein, partial [Anaerolineae bacterium]|nr:glycoside hydrolase family 65 protein [Anaerolineae bacterium]
RQTMLNVPNARIVRLILVDEPFDLLTGELLAHRRWLDLRAGVLYRELVWRSPQGREIRVHSERLVSHTRPHVAALRYTVTPLNFAGPVHVLSALEGDVANHAGSAHDPRLGAGFRGRVLEPAALHAGPERVWLVSETRTTAFRVACGFRDALEGEDASPRVAEQGLALSHVYDVAAARGAPIVLFKVMAYFTSRDTPQDRLVDATVQALDAAFDTGYAALQAEQRAYLDDFWRRADITIEGDAQLQRGLRFNMFHLLQSAGKDGRTNIAAKGLTGEGYEGHTFWDTETYVLPFFLHTAPEVSRKLLEYRYHQLDKARERARQMAHPVGALYPWRTIGGEECSPFFPAGTAQYHIDADIAFAVKRYVEATEDTAFLRDFGVEMLVETARLWYHTGTFVEGKGFCIHDVTGPDEYSCIVNNNAYTNLMARENLRFAAESVAWLQETAPDGYQTLADRLALDAAEPAAWRAAADRMFIPYDAARGVIAQDDAFLEKPVWDFENTPKAHYPLLLHYHPLVLYRYQVCKQADLVLAEYLLNDQFDAAQKKRDFDYYEPLTTHDSSLSACIFGIMAAELGYADKAYRYFADSAIADLEDKKGNTKDGVHIANMAGAWQGVVFGFGGMRVTPEGLSFRPTLPARWKGYTFKVSYRGRLIEVRVTGAGAHLRLLEGDPLTVILDRKPLALKMTA